MDNTNILTLGKNRKSLSNKLRFIHSRCLFWARRYGALFSLEKYSLLLLYNKGRGEEKVKEGGKKKKRKEKEDLNSPFYLNNIPIIPSKTIRILGIYLSSNLRWKDNTSFIRERVLERFGVLNRSTFSTRGFPPLVARVIYIAALRAILSYGGGIWSSSITKKELSSLEVLQNQALRKVLGVFKSTPITLLEREAYISPLRVYLKARLEKYNSLALENKPFLALLRESTKDLSNYLSISYKDPLLEREKSLKDYLTLNSQEEEVNREKAIKRSLFKEWERSQLLKYKDNPNIFTPPLEKKALSLFKDLKRYKCSLLSQIRTGKIGLNSFLYSIKAKDTPYCLECLGGRETPSHIISFCPFYKENRLILKEKINNILKRPLLTPLYLREILKNKATLPILLDWFLSLKKLDQFSYSYTLLDSPSSSFLSLSPTSSPPLPPLLPPTT